MTLHARDRQSGFIHAGPDALRIPGRMELDELAFLAALAAQVPDGGHIVEIGAFYGRSTNAMARANPRARITSIDTFEDVDWTRRYAASYVEVPVFGRAAFERYTRNLGNVDAVTGFSPDVASDWSAPIDLYFEDAIHGNPGLKRNLDFWTRRLKPGGIACGHDYGLRFPDIKAEVDAIAHAWGTRVRVVGSLWALRKPGTSAACDVMPPLRREPRLTVRTENRERGPDMAHDGYWCGAHPEVDRMHWLSIDDIARETGLGLEYRLGHPTHGATGWTAAGTMARLDAGGRTRPFTRVAIRLRGPADQALPHVIYRVSARQIGKGGAGLSGTSPWAADGAWAALPTEGPAVNAVTVSLAHELPPKPQSAFTRTRPDLWTGVKKLIRNNVLSGS